MKEKCRFCKGTGRQNSYQPSILNSLLNTTSGFNISGQGLAGRQKEESQCRICIGLGEIEKVKESFDCPFCKGNGGFEHYKYKEICDDCNGMGWIEGQANFIDKELLKRDLPRLNCYVIFIDIVKYSKRLPILQRDIIKILKKILNNTIQNLQKENEEALSKNTINLYKDSIIIPVGDGIVIGFPFDFIKEIHLSFIKKFLNFLENENKNYFYCDSLNSTDQYCNEHAHFKVKIGIGKGDCLIYKDINHRYNFAGDEVNLTARVMSKALLTGTAFTNNAYNDTIAYNVNSKLAFKVENGVKIENKDTTIDVFHYKLSS